MIDTLKKDENIMVLPADKSQMTVVMKEEYVEKCKLLLKDEKTYQKLNWDPTSKYKDKFVEVLQDLKDTEVIDKIIQEALSNSGSAPWVLWPPSKPQSQHAVCSCIL